MRFNAARAASALASVALAFVVAVPASAQEPAPPAPVVPDEAELTVFANAYIDVQEIATATEAKVAAATTEEEKAQIQAAAEQEQAAALQKYQIDQVRYEEIASMLNSDPELRAQFDAIHAKVLEERKGGG